MSLRTADWRPGSRDGGERTRGSVTPLILGMALILLLLGLGVAAAGSAFLNHQQLQALCDGAAAAAGDTVRPDPAGGASVDPSPSAAVQAADSYLQTHGVRVDVQAVVSAGSVRLTCRMTAPVSFAGLFQLDDVQFGAQSVGRPTLRG